jgi:hypothetical protein
VLLLTIQRSDQKVYIPPILKELMKFFVLPFEFSFGSNRIPFYGRNILIGIGRRIRIYHLKFSSPEGNQEESLQRKSLVRT